MQYFTLLTAKGAEKIAAATAANTTVDLTHIALGDGNGSVVMPDASKTALVNEVYRASLNDLRVDATNANWVVAESNVPASQGNFWVREVGVFDVDGDLIAIGNYPETFKPVTADGVAKDLYMKVIFEVSSSDAVTLQVDPSVVMASQEYVNNEMAKKADANHNHDTSYAAIIGDTTKNFSVKAATAAKHAVNKEQMENAIAAAGKVLQIEYAYDNTPRVSSNTIPKDATVPNSNEGMQILTCSITPKSANSKFIIFMNAYGTETSNHSDNLVMTLFRNNESSALDVFMYVVDGWGNLYMRNIQGQSIVPNIDLNEKTFQVRLGCNSGPIATLKGDTTQYYNTGDYGNKLKNSIIIMEVENDN